MLDFSVLSVLALHAVLLHFVRKTVDFLGPPYMIVARAVDEVVAPTDASDDVDDNNNDGVEAPSLPSGC